MLAIDTDPDVAYDQLRERLIQLGDGRMPAKVWTCIQSPGMILQSLQIPRVQSTAMSSAAFWTLKKERNLANEDTVFDIEPLRLVQEEGAVHQELLAIAVPQDELDQSRQEEAKLGARATGITPQVFAVRNVLRLDYPELATSTCGVLLINDASSDVLVFDSGQLLTVRTLRTGLDSLRESIAHILDVDLNSPQVDACLAMLAGEKVSPAVFGERTPPTRDQVFEWATAVAHRLARNVQRVLHAFEGVIAGGSTGAPVFLIAGGITRYHCLVEYLSEQMGLHLQPLLAARPSQEAKASSTNEPMLPRPPATPEPSGMAIAVGLALAESYHTPNLLFPYEEREKLRKRSSSFRMLRLVCLFVAAALVLGAAYVQRQVHGKEKEIERLRQQVTEGEKLYSKEEIARLSDEVIGLQLKMKRLSEIYFSPAVVAEIASLTPPSISLLDIQLDFAPTAATGDQASPKTVAGAARAKRTNHPVATAGNAQRDVLRLRGVVRGTPDRMDAILAEYFFRLQGSPLLQMPRLMERKLEPVDPNYLVFGEEADGKKPGYLLFFTLDADLRQERPVPPPEVAAKTKEAKR
jgi:Tfp pilus assembly PilM family ATPase